ncbi:MAG: SDR family oxidoreductase [Bdellovibrionota bacterium]
MQLGLQGARVAIAGSSRGMGFAIAKAFFEEGAEVWITGRDEKQLLKASKALANCKFTICDLERGDDRKRFFSEVEQTWTSLDILVLNVGSGQASHAGLDTPDEEWHRVLNLNLVSHAGLLRLFRPLLKTSRKASVVGISSIAGQTRLGAPVSYSAAKSALEHFCVIASKELAEDSIRFNLVAPGNIYAEGGRWEALMTRDKEKIEQHIQAAVPMKRFGKPEEIASFVVFLASTQASFCTGSVVRVDGGQTPA